MYSVTINIVCYCICILGIIVAITVNDNRIYGKISSSDFDNLVLTGIVICISHGVTFLIKSPAYGEGFLVVITAIYLLITTVLLIIGSWLEKRINVFAVFVLLLTLICTFDYFCKVKGWY